MVEGDLDKYHSSITGEVYECYWHGTALDELAKNIPIEESLIPISREECSKCSLEFCLNCSGYCPHATKTYKTNKPEEIKK